MASLRVSELPHNYSDDSSPIPPYQISLARPPKSMLISFLAGGADRLWLLLHLAFSSQTSADVTEGICDCGYC